MTMVFVFFVVVGGGALFRCRDSDKRKSFSGTFTSGASSVALLVRVSFAQQVVPIRTGKFEFISGNDVLCCR